MSDIRVGFIGLGNMGGAMAKRLASKGFTLSVYDLMKEAVKELESVGATAASSSREVAAACNIIFSMVRDVPQTDEVIFGKDGVWQGISEGKTIVISSSIGPSYCRKLYDKAKDHGVRVIDCGVSDPTVFKHEPGALTLMLGGDEDAVEQCWPVFEAMGKNVFYLGKIGNGQTHKLINNMTIKHLGVIERLCLIECLNLGLRAGLDLQKMIEVMNVNAGARLIQNMGFHPGLDEKQTLEALRIPASRASDTGAHHKDELDYGMEMAEELGVGMPVCRFIDELDAGSIYDEYLSLQKGSFSDA